jgi:glycosyltransferase involved in cell wall biosynthesis
VKSGSDQPLISVIMTVYERPDFLEEAIDSFLEQTHRNFEFLIADDGSSSNVTRDILARA